MSKSITAIAEQHFQSLGLEETDIDPALRLIEVEGGKIDLGVYHSVKIDKLILCTIELFETGVLESSVMAWPKDDYCFPALWCNLTIVPEVMNIPIFDFVPLMDPVVSPDYAEKYLVDLGEMRAKALETLGDAVTDKAVDLPSATVFALSPHKLVAKITDAGVVRVPEAMAAYFTAYAELVKGDTPIESTTDRHAYLAKKSATLKLMKENDPGYPFMLDIFGDELTAKVFNIIF